MLDIFPGSIPSDELQYIYNVLVFYKNLKWKSYVLLYNNTTRDYEYTQSSLHLLQYENTWIYETTNAYSVHHLLIDHIQNI